MYIVSVHFRYEHEVNDLGSRFTLFSIHMKKSFKALRSVLQTMYVAAHNVVLILEIPQVVRAK